MQREFFSDYRFRCLVLVLVGLIGIGILAAKLYFEQIRRGEDYRRKISRQSVRRIRIPALRGKIFSSDLQVLAENAAGCMILFYPEEMRRPGPRGRTVDYMMQAAAAVASALKRENPLSREEIVRHLNVRPGLPITLFRGLTPAEAAPALELTRNFDGIGLEADDNRIYPGGRFAAHLLGYTRRDNPRAAEDREDFFYYVPDQVGRTGLEKAFDRFPGDAADGIGLRGIPGYQLVQVDNQGFIRNDALASREPVNGNHLVLSLDSRAQRTAEQLLAGRRGAFVLLDAETGGVLAMVSSPAYNLQLFTPRLSPEYYSLLLHNADRPLINRALNGTYTPGSILKVLVAMALLENGIDSTRKVNCTGRTAIGTGGIRCAARNGHGEVDLLTALERSCNGYFIEMGCEVGRSAIAEALAAAGIGRSTGIELADSRGVAPTVEYKRRFYGSGWNKFDTAQLSIGQGIILLTPIQAAVYTAAIANGGRMLRPRLVEKMVNQSGGELWRSRPEETGRLAVSPEHLALIRQGMFQVVHAPEGSGRRGATEALELYGKTGSAEVGPRDRRWKNTWFIAFGTHRDRTYAAVMLVEEGASGGGTCAPLVGEFFRRYLTAVDAAADDLPPVSDDPGVEMP